MNHDRQRKTDAVTLPTPSLALVKRELLTSLRQPRTFGLLALTAGMFLIVTPLSFSGGLTPRNIEELFEWFVIVLCGAACLFIPPIAGTSVCVEKQQRSFDLLRATLIRPSGIVAAKLLNVLSIYLFIVIACMPIVGVLFFFAGIEWHQFFQVFVLIALLAVACASVGLLCSTIFYRVIPSIAGSYVGLLVFFGTPVAMVMLGGAILVHLLPYTQWRDTLIRWLDSRLFEPVMTSASRFWCPLVSMGMAVEGTLSAKFFLGAVAFQIGFIVICNLLTIRILRRPAKPPKVDHRKPIDDVRVLRRRRRRFPFYLIDPLRRRKPIADSKNPLHVKDLYTGLVTKGTGRVRLFYLYAILSMLFGGIGVVGYRSSDFAETVGYCFFAQTVCMLVAAPALAATNMAKERELGNMDMLRSTLLRPKEIIRGKLTAGCAGAATLFLASLVGFSPILVLSVRDPDAFAACVTGVVTMVMSVVLVVCLSLRVTLTSRRTAAALVVSYLASLVLMAGLPFVALWFLHTLDTLNFIRLSFDEMPWTIFTICLIPSPAVVQFENLGEFQTELNSYFNRYWFANIASSALFSYYLVRRSITLYNRKLARDP